MQRFNTLSIADLTDPEQAANYGIINQGNSEFYLDEVKNQIKLNFLCSDKLYIPLGFMIDNPAIWELLIHEPGFKESFLQSSQDQQSSICLGIGYNPNVEGGFESFDEAFNCWRVGYDYKRILSPSALRTHGVETKMDTFEFLKWNRETRFDQVTLGEYAVQLGLSKLVKLYRTLEDIYKISYKVRNPENRHEQLLKSIQKCSWDSISLQTKEQRNAWGQVVKLIDSKLINKISRSELNQYLDQSVWDEVSPQINSMRLSCYLDNMQDEFSPLHMPTQTNNYAVTESFLEQMIKLLNVNSENPTGKYINLNVLTFNDIAEIRKRNEFKSVLSKISDIDYSLGNDVETLVNHCRYLREEWIECMVDLLVEINPNSIDYSSKNKTDDENQKDVVKRYTWGALATATSSAVASVNAPMIPLGIAGSAVALIFVSGAIFWNYIKADNVKRIKKSIITNLTKYQNDKIP